MRRRRLLGLAALALSPLAVRAQAGIRVEVWKDPNCGCCVSGPKIGLAVPGMPVGSPGMDGPLYGGRKDAYAVLLVGRDGGTRVFQSYPGS